MGMTYMVKSISDKNIDLLLKYPILFHKFTWPEPGGAEQYYEFDESIPPLELTELEGAEIDLYKSWHGLHYLLTNSGSDNHWPYNFLLNETDSKQLKDIDDGYGSAIYDSSQTKEIFQMLSEISEDDLKSRFNPDSAEAGQIYCYFGGEQIEEELEELVEFFMTLKLQIESFVNNNLGMVLWLT